MKKIIFIALAIIIVAGIIITATIGLNVDIMYKAHEQINIYIGKETNLDDDITVIKTNYKTDKDNGTIAIIGPKRMEYSRVVNLLEYIKKQIEGDKNGW